MKSTRHVKIIVLFVLLVVLVPLLAVYVAGIRGGKTEAKDGAPPPLVITDMMTIGEFGQQNNIPNEVLKKVFSLQGQQDLSKKIAEFNMNREEIVEKTGKAMALKGEYESKDWFLIPLKFGAWILLLAAVFVLMKKELITEKWRNILYLVAITIFGIIFGSDPNPMGTIKDTFALLGIKRIIFPPRLIALAFFLAVTFVANKFICAWGCHFGTLQDVIFRVNRDKKGQQGVWRQYKLPFAVTNGIRIAFFVIFVAFAFIWSTDIIGPVDPFKIYKLSAVGIYAWVFFGVLLVASLFVYRPWCHLFCPFGLAGWLVEKGSVFKIKVDYKACIACEACAKACPSTVMEAILKQERTIPDCFACATCIQNCPAQAIHFRSGRRDKPPEGKFNAAKP